MFPDPSIREFYIRHLARALVGRSNCGLFFFLIGKGSNGKSTLNNLIEAALGEYASTAPTSLIVNAKRPDAGKAQPELMDLRGRRVIAMHEPEKHERLSEGTMKQLTGGDKISGRNLYESTSTFHVQGTFFFLCNTAPEIRAQDYGTWRRLRFIPFDSQFKDQDDLPNETQPNVFKKDPSLEHHIDQLGAVLISYLIHVLKSKGKPIFKDASVPQRIQQLSKEIQMKNNMIMQFLNEHYLLDAKSSNFVTSKTLWSQLKSFAAIKNERVREKDAMDLLQLTYKDFTCNALGQQGWYIEPKIVETSM